MKILTLQEIEKKLSLIPKWKYKNDFIECEYEFSSFKKAIHFLNQVAAISETQQHHPVLKNDYHKVMVQVRTHDANGVTQKDFDLAVAIEKLPL